ncbi:LuxR family transcriptional regulator [Maritimibacter fusiformis]|nr:LuxR family transcriptional regulator [Maritimibacter fusiformis]
MLEYFSRLAAATSQDDAWKLHCEQMAEFGFDRLLFGYARYCRPDGSDRTDDVLFLSNHDPALTRRYVEDGLYRHDPVLNWAARHVGARSWRDAMTRAVQDDSRLEKSRSLHSLMNVTAGYSIAFAHPSARCRGFIHLAARPDLDQDAVDAIWHRDGRLIETMNHILNLKLMALPRSGQRAPLSERQREALEWVADGKSYRDIAAIMGVTQATVEKHLRLARGKLEVETTAQAILKAAIQNQIFQD